LQRIRSSLDKINKLISDLKTLSWNVQLQPAFCY
jgi:hypothetical protein